MMQETGLRRRTVNWQTTDLGVCGLRSYLMKRGVEISSCVNQVLAEV
jgi:hypothetical protein